MKITLITVGKPRQNFIIDGISEYIKRLNGFTDFAMIHVKERDLLEKLMKTTKRARLILLDERGDVFTSNAFAKFLEKEKQLSHDLVFLIGGTEGHTPEVRALTHASMALSSFTLPHELALLMFTETLYRSLTITAGHPYHRE